MTEFTLSYREVIPDQSSLDNWKEITLTTGGTQSTLQDIKVPERANGFCYEDSIKPHMRNRFIYWRINYDVLELVEHSLDINLTGNHIRYRFTDTPILDGVSIHETYENVVVLVPTVCSVHRLVFPHPDRFHRDDQYLGMHPDLAAPSIFSKALALDAKKPSSFHVFNSPSTAGDQLPNLAASYLLPETEEAFFVLTYPSRELLLIKKLPDSPEMMTTELKGESLVPKFLSGIASKFLQKNVDGDSIVSVQFYVMNSEMYVLTLSRAAHLKFWSCAREQCVAVVDVLAETGSNVRDQLQTAILRKAVDSTDLKNTLAVLLTSNSSSEFHILNPTVNGQQIKINPTHTFYGPEDDLIDFAIQNNRLWSIWRDMKGDCASYTMSLNSGPFTKSWIPVVLEDLPYKEAPLVKHEGPDPRQTFLQLIFYPGRFPLHIIGKALCIYGRSAVMTDSHFTVSALKQRVCMAVDNEIQTVLDGNIVSDDQYRDISEWCWKKFYSCCVQYHIASLKPLGLMLLPNVSGAVFLKKSSFSLLRPLDPLEYMTLCSEIIEKEQCINFALSSEDPETSEDIMNIFKIIVYLEQELSESFKINFEEKMLTLQSPDQILDHLLEKLNGATDKEDCESDKRDCEFDSQLCLDVLEMLSSINGLNRAIPKILELLRNESTLANPDNEVNPSALYYFNSRLGVSVIVTCMRQQAQIRFQICRNLLLICLILLNNGRVEGGVLEVIRSVCVPEIVVLTQANFVMLWLSQLPALINQTQENCIQRLSVIKLPPVFNYTSPSNVSLSLLEFFIASTGGAEFRKAFARVTCREEDLAHWHWSLLPLLNHLRHIICPVSGVTILEEWLLSSGQHLWLQEYVRLLSNWCEWNSCTRNFLLACSFLTSGENYKAQELFVSAVTGISTDNFLHQRVVKSEADNINSARVNYYLKVIQLLELHKARDCAIHIANIALSGVDQRDPSAATFYSIKFKHHLALRHYEEAFYSLNNNPDAERKKDNLRDLIKTLLDEKKLDVILSFTYGDLEEFFTEIILTRARATDGIDNIFYDFLYSYHVNKGPCYRLAAAAMYEQAYRLSYANSVEALEKQVKCYLASKNLLQLCKPEHAWVLRPGDPDAEDGRIVLETKAKSEQEVLQIKRQVEVVTVDMIKKELKFSSARLKLVKFDPKCSNNISTTVELVTLLSNAGLFKTAMDICSEFSMPYTSVFESLTKQCVLLSEQEDPSAWNWLLENDLQDLPANRDNLASVVWRLLEDYLNKYEEPNLSTLHYVVCKKIISMNIYVPFWLLSSYKVLNCGEFLLLLHGSGRLQEAVEVAHGLILASLGYGKECYGFTQSLASISPPFCLPVYGIKQLIEELEMQNVNNSEKPYLQEYEDLNALLQKYLETSSRISNQKCLTAGLSSGTIKRSILA